MSLRARAPEKKPTGPAVIMPRFYHYNRFGSDRDWIMTRMAVIPPEMQQEVADEYEKRYAAKNVVGRRMANEYLSGVAREFREKLRAEGRLRHG